MSVKTVVVAHRSARVRERFAAALAEARHACVLADTEASLRGALAARREDVSLALVDLGVTSPDAAVSLVAAVAQAGARPIPVVLFAGSVGSGDAVADLGAAGVVGYINEHAHLNAVLPALAPHLFPDNFNRRAGPRCAVALPMSYRAGPTIAGARTRDVGRGGVGIQTMEPVPAGTPIQVSFTLHFTSAGQPSTTDRSDISAFGRVVWSNRRVGMGIQFERLPAEAQRALDAYVDGQ